MGSGCHLAQRIDHSGKGHIAKGCTEALEHIGHGDFQAGFQNFTVGLQAAAFWRDHGMAPQCHSDLNTTQQKRNGTGSCSTGNSPARTGHEELIAEDIQRSGGIDQQEIQYNIDDIDQNTHLHGSFCIACRSQSRAEDNGGGSGQHGQIQNKEILTGEVTNGYIHLHPHGNQAA